MAQDEKNPLFSERVREQLLLQRILVLDGVLLVLSHASSLRHDRPGNPRPLL